MSRARTNDSMVLGRSCHTFAWSTFGLFSAGLALVGVVLFGAAGARADVIGGSDPIGWTGTYAGIRHGPSRVDPAGEWEFVEFEDNLGTPNTVSEAPDQEHSHYYQAYWENEEEEGYITAYARTAPYGAAAYNSTRNWHDGSTTYPRNSVQVGGYWRDELYFEVSDGEPGYMEFDLHISFELNTRFDEETGVVPDGSFAEFKLNLLGYIGEAEWGHNFALLDDFQRTIEPGDALPYMSYEDTVTLSTNAAGHLFESGTYIPLSFTSWTYASDGTIDAEGTVALTDVRVFDAAGNLLTPGQYVLQSTQDEYFDFQSVPEPASWLLLGCGLLSLAWLARRRS